MFKLFIAVYNWAFVQSSITVLNEMYLQVASKGKRFLTVITFILFTLCMTVGMLPCFTTLITFDFVMVFSEMIVQSSKRVILAVTFCALKPFRFMFL